MATATTEEMKRLNVNIPADLHRDIKITATKNGDTIAQFVMDAIKEKLAKEQ